MHPLRDIFRKSIPERLQALAFEETRYSLMVAELNAISGLHLGVGVRREAAARVIFIEQTQWLCRQPKCVAQRKFDKDGRRACPGIFEECFDVFGALDDIYLLVEKLDAHWVGLLEKVASENSQ
jgi:hypothetical protein